MAQLGQYKIPRELKDEDLWLKIFKKKQLVIAIFIFALDWNIVTLSNKLHLTVVGVTLAVLITLIAGIIIFGVMPKKKHLYGGGLEMEKIAIRLFIRKVLKSSRRIYTPIREEDGGFL